MSILSKHHCLVFRTLNPASLSDVPFELISGRPCIGNGQKSGAPPSGTGPMPLSTSDFSTFGQKKFIDDGEDWQSSAKSCAASSSSEYSIVEATSQCATRKRTMLRARFANPWQLCICRRSAIAACSCSGPAWWLPKVMTCVIVEASTKYGTKDGVRSKV